MSQYSEIMEKMESLEGTLNWCAAAILQLLSERTGVAPEPVEFGDLDLEDLDTGDFDAELAEAAAAVVHGGGCPHVRTVIRGGHVVCTQCADDLGCSHNQQVLVSGRLVCSTCHTVLGQSGVVGRDPNAPQAGAQTREGGARGSAPTLVPY